MLFRSTLAAFADHGVLSTRPMWDSYPAARDHLDALRRLGIDYAEVTDLLEREGLTKFTKSWDELGRTVAKELHATAK